MARVGWSLSGGHGGLQPVRKEVSPMCRRLISILAIFAFLSIGVVTKALAQQANPCAAKPANPCAAKPQKY